MATATFKTIATRTSSGRILTHEVTHEDGRVACFPYSDPRTSFDLFSAVEELWPDVDTLDGDPP